MKFQEYVIEYENHVVFCTGLNSLYVEVGYHCEHEQTPFTISTLEQFKEKMNKEAKE